METRRMRSSPSVRRFIPLLFVPIVFVFRDCREQRRCGLGRGVRGQGNAVVRWRGMLGAGLRFNDDGTRL